mgnify:CR=1 FL=1
MAVGTPVITTTNCGSGMEILKNGNGGRIVPSEDPDSLMIAMKDMLNDAELAKQTRCADIHDRKYGKANCKSNS